MSSAHRPLDRAYDELAELIQAELSRDADGPPPDWPLIVARVLSIAPAHFAQADDAARFIHMLAFATRGPTAHHPADDARAWRWAQAVAEPFGGDASVLGLLAALGDQLRHKAGSVLADGISTPELASMFQRSMALAPASAVAFGRAGLFFLGAGDDAEAERCLTTAFTLDPTVGFIAQRLADLYDHTNRSEQGLQVLDQCLRATDASDPDVLWKAGLAATAMNKHDAALAYLTRFERLKPDQRWAAYYRAVALLELKRFAEAGQAIEQEASRILMPTALHVHAVRAAAAAGLGDLPGVRRHVTAAVASPLSLVNYLPQSGVVGCFTRLWDAVERLPANDAVRVRLEARMLGSGLTPREFWDAARSAPTTGLTHYWCDLSQPLDPRWTDDGFALHGTEAWTAYRIRYGVLATNESDAVRHALTWQQRSAPLAPTVEAVTIDGGPFNDRPGVTWRGYPEPVR